MKIEIIKNHKTKKRTYLKGQTLDVMPWKAEEFFKRKVARVLFKKEVHVPIQTAETAEKKDLKETR